MDATLTILSAGGGVTLQDAGRHGYMRYGITPAGPMDPLAHAGANRALDNPPGATAIEISLGGVSLTVAGAALDVSLVGGGFRIDHDGRTLPCATALTLQPEARLTIRAGSTGAWCYLGVAGSIAAAPTLGSTATHTRSGLGGLDGRALRAGDAVPIARPRAAIGEPSLLVVPWLEVPWLDVPRPEVPRLEVPRLEVPRLDRPPGTIRVVLGPQDDHFDPAAVAAFLAGPWRIGARGDRMACFLEGAPIRARDHNIVSDGIAMGAIQVPGTGQPIVLMADRQPTGGYPKIATVIGADLGCLAQARAGDSLRFAAISVPEAVRARRLAEESLAGPIVRRPLVRTAFTSEFLLARNLIGGVVG